MEAQPAIRCSACGHGNRPERRFCTECGRRLGRACAACGTPTGAEEKFCGHCGAPLAEPVAAARAPAAYTPKHLAEKILKSRSAIEGERKHVTVLFGDVKGSMDLSEQVDPEEWHKIMDRFFAILSDGVQLLDTLPETPEHLAERATVRAQIMIQLARLGDLEDNVTLLSREGRELATRSGDPHVLSQVLHAFGFSRIYGGAVAEALEPLLESIQRADETGDIGLRVVARQGLSANYWIAGRLRECLAVAEQGLGLARGDLDLGTDRLPIRAEQVAKELES